MLPLFMCPRLDMEIQDIEIQDFATSNLSISIGYFAGSKTFTSALALAGNARFFPGRQSFAIDLPQVIGVLRAVSRTQAESVGRSMLRLG